MRFLKLLSATIFTLSLLYLPAALGQNQDRSILEAAVQGDAKAQYGLGLMYANGIGVRQDDQIARHWYEKAAAQGHARAQFNLGVMYANGQGVRQDDQIARQWFEKAAEQGHAQAQYNLWVM